MNGFGEMLRRVRERKPLVHHITNLVVTNVTANITLCSGALPVMAHSIEESPDMAGAASALVLNIGTLTPELIESMVAAGKSANRMGIPVVFDPVGAGATRLRTESSRRILGEVEIAVIRGNAAEVGVLAGLGGEIRGVESVGGSDRAMEAARTLAKQARAVVAVTGPRDVVSDGRRTAIVENGHPMLGNVTGTGCMATSVVAAFAAVEKDHLMAAAGALAYFGLAGEYAAANSRGPGSFAASLLDEAYGMTPERLDGGARVSFEGG